MNDVMKYDIGDINPEYPALLDERKLAILGSLATGRVSALEFLASDSDMAITQAALDELESAGDIHRAYDANLSSSGNVMVFYERPTASIAVSAHPTITKKLNELNERAWKRGNINLLNAEEWCLRTILEKADTLVTSGELEIDLAVIKTKMLDDLHDEGLEKWEAAFDVATGTARQLFMPHPDSTI